MGEETNRRNSELPKHQEIFETNFPAVVMPLPPLTRPDLGIFVPSSPAGVAPLPRVSVLPHLAPSDPRR